MIQRGMILAAGLGTRMRPLTLKRPKPLCELLGKTLIEYTLNNFSELGVKEVMINTHYLSGQIPQFLGAGYKNIKIEYQHEKEILDSGGGISKASAFLLEKPGPYLISNADTPTVLDLAELKKYLKKNEVNNLLIAKKNLKNKEGSQYLYDLAWDSNGKLVRIRIPDKFAVKSKYNCGKYCGYQLINTDLLEAYPKLEKYSYIADFYEKKLADWKFRAFDDVGDFFDISSSQDLFEINMNLLAENRKAQNSKYFERFEKVRDGIYVGKNVSISPSASLEGPLVLDDNSSVGPGVVLGPFVVLGKSAYIRQNSVVARSVIFSRSSVLGEARLENSIVCDDLILNL